MEISPCFSLQSAEMKDGQHHAHALSILQKQQWEHGGHTGPEAQILGSVPGAGLSQHGWKWTVVLDGGGGPVITERKGPQRDCSAARQCSFSGWAKNIATQGPSSHRVFLSQMLSFVVVFLFLFLLSFSFFLSFALFCFSLFPSEGARQRHTLFFKPAPQSTFCMCHKDTGPWCSQLPGILSPASNSHTHTHHGVSAVFTVAVYSHTH